MIMITKLMNIMIKRRYSDGDSHHVVRHDSRCWEAATQSGPSGPPAPGGTGPRALPQTPVIAGSSERFPYPRAPCSAAPLRRSASALRVTAVALNLELHGLTFSAFRFYILFSFVFCFRQMSDFVTHFSSPVGEVKGKLISAMNEVSRTEEKMEQNKIK